MYYFIIEYKQGEWMNYCLIQQYGWNLQTSHWGENNREEIYMYTCIWRQTQAKLICDTRAQNSSCCLKKGDVCNGQGHQDTISQCVECSVA